MKTVLYFAIVVSTCLTFVTPIAGTELKFATQEFAPFVYQIEGVVSGPVVDIIVEACKEMKINCSFESLPWPRAQFYVRKGKMHGLFVLAWNEERSEWLSFSPPITNTEYGFFVRSDNSLKYRQPSNIKGYTIGVYGPSNTSKSLRKIKDEMKDIKIDMTPYDEFAFKKLSAARVDAVYSNRDAGYALIKKLGLKNIRYAGTHKKLKYYIALSKDFTNTKIATEFNSTLVDLQSRGVTQKILDKYFLKAVANRVKP